MTMRENEAASLEAFEALEGLKVMQSSLKDSKRLEVFWEWFEVFFGSALKCLGCFAAF